MLTFYLHLSWFIDKSCSRATVSNSGVPHLWTDLWWSWSGRGWCWCWRGPAPPPGRPPPPAPRPRAAHSARSAAAGLLVTDHPYPCRNLEDNASCDLYCPSDVGLKHIKTLEITFASEHFKKNEWLNETWLVGAIKILVPQIAILSILMSIIWTLVYIIWLI